jgi:hypothetical protein
MEAITFTPPLPCGQVDLTRRDAEFPICGRTTTQGIITPLGAGAWELLPLCDRHLPSTEVGYTSAP